MRITEKQALTIGIPAFALGIMFQMLVFPRDPSAISSHSRRLSAVRGARSTMKDREATRARWLKVDVYRADPDTVGSPAKLEAVLRGAATSRGFDLGTSADTMRFGTGGGFQAVVRGPDGYLAATSWPAAEMVMLDLWLFAEPDETLDDMDATMAVLVEAVGGAVSHSKWSAGQRGTEGITDVEEVVWTKHWLDRQRVGYVHSKFQKIEVWEFGDEENVEVLESGDVSNVVAGQSYDAAAVAAAAAAAAAAAKSKDRPDHFADFTSTTTYRVLTLDGIVQSSTVDERVYHESLVHPAMISHPRGAERVAILGGGEGGTLREVLKYPSVKEAVMVELDPGVVDACKEWLPSMSNCTWQKPGTEFFSCFDDPRTNLVPQDAFKWFKERFGDDSCASTADKFDVIILDLLDPEYLPDVDFAAQLYGPTFLKQLGCALTDDGVLVGQIGESPWPSASGLDMRVAKIKVPILHEIAANFIPHGTFVYDVFVQSFRGEWAFALACKSQTCANRFTASQADTDRALRQRLDPRSQLSGPDANRLANDMSIDVDDSPYGLDWFDGSTLQKMQHTHRAWEDAYCSVAYNEAKKEGQTFTGCDPTAEVAVPGAAKNGAQPRWEPFIARHVASSELFSESSRP